MWKISHSQKVQMCVCFFFRRHCSSPSLSISNTLMASCGVRFLNSLAGSVCRLCRRGLTTETGVFRKKGLRNGEPLSCCVMMPQCYNTGGCGNFSEIFSPSSSSSLALLQYSVLSMMQSDVKLPLSLVSQLFSALWLPSVDETLTFVSPPPLLPLSAHTVKWLSQSRIALSARVCKVS